jgi:hypothetical protein
LEAVKSSDWQLLLELREESGSMMARDDGMQAVCCGMKRMVRYEHTTNKLSVTNIKQLWKG